MRKMMKRISAEDFIRAWQTSGTPAEAAEKLGRNGTTGITSRACVYRKKGIPLKKMHVGARLINLAPLIELAESLSGDEQSNEKAKPESTSKSKKRTRKK